jgi:hypothetical protein
MPEIPEYQKANNEKMADEMIYLAERVRRGEFWWRMDFNGHGVIDGKQVEGLRVISLAPEKPKGY